MEKRLYTLADVEKNLASVVQVINSRRAKKLTPVDLLTANHTLMWWVFAHGNHLLAMIKEEQFASQLLFEPFWSLCAAYGIELTGQQQQEIIENFVND